MTANTDVRQLLLRYGQHDRNCTYHDDLFLEEDERVCSCGFRAALSAPEPREPLAKTIERVLDDNSAWISAPNKQVVRDIAWAAAIAAQDMAKEMLAEVATPEPAAPPAGVRASGSDLERKLIEAIEPFIDCDEKFERWPDYWPVDEHGYCESCLGHGRTRRSFPKLKDHDPDCKLRSAYELLAAIRQLQQEG